MWFLCTWPWLYIHGLCTILIFAKGKKKRTKNETNLFTRVMIYALKIDQTKNHRHKHFNDHFVIYRANQQVTSSISYQKFKKIRAFIRDQYHTLVNRAIRRKSVQFIIHILIRENVGPKAYTSVLASVYMCDCVNRRANIT